MALISLLAVTALAVTSITTERDRGSLDLLLVGDLEREFIWGKLFGHLRLHEKLLFFLFCSVSAQSQAG